MRGWWCAVGLAVLAAGCRRAEPSAAATAVLRVHCGGCHVPASPSARSRALAVFDLTQPRWWSGLSREQLAKSAQMLDARLTLTEPELAEFFAGWGPPRRPTDEERRRYRAFVDGALGEGDGG